MRILFVKLGAIGDIIQSAVALTEYRARFPATAVDWSTGTGMESLVQATGIADRVIGGDEQAMIFGALPSRLGSLLRYMARVRSHCAPHYDSILTGYLNRRSKSLTAMVRAGSRRSLGDSCERSNYILTRNRVHEYWRLLTQQDSESIDIAGATAALGRRVLQQAAGQAPAGLSGGNVVVAAGGAKILHRVDALRRWPIERYRDLVGALLNCGQRILLVGSES